MSAPELTRPAPTATSAAPVNPGPTNPTPTSPGPTDPAPTSAAPTSAAPTSAGPTAAELAGVLEHFEALARAARTANAYADTVARWGAELARRYRAGGQLLACGNGGSAAEALHLTGELLGRFRFDRRPLPAVTLGSDLAAATAIGNDYGAEEVFARQVRAYGRPGDVLVAFSTSGTSPNVLAAAKAALEVGVTVWGLTGPGPNPLAAVVDDAIAVAADTTATVQEVHLSIVHALCLTLDRALGVPV